MKLLLSILALIFLLMNGYAEAQVVRVAHRGAPHFAPENTIISFEKATSLGADWLELDVQQTQDGALVILHDASVDRTTNGTGLLIEYNLSALKLLDAGSWFGQQFQGEEIPTLNELFEKFSGYSNVKYVLELKEGNDVYPDIEEKLIAAIKSYRLENQVILKSFSYPLLQRLRVLAPSIPQIYVFLAAFPGVTIDRGIKFYNSFDLDVEYIQPHKNGASRSLIEKAKAHGKRVIVWGVEKESDMRHWIDKGAYGIETDRLDLLNQVIGEL